MSATTTSVVSLSPLPSWALAAAAAAVLVGVGLACWGVRREVNPARRRLMWGLRVLAGAAALFFLLEPGVRQVQVAQVKSRLAVVVDRSASMSFPSSQAGKTRSQEVAEAITRLTAEWTRDGSTAVELYGAESQLSPLTPAGLTAAPTGGKSDLLGALKSLKLAEGSSARALSGVLFFSDGADNVELPGAELTEPAKQALAALKVPVSTVVVGASDAEDLAIETVKVDDFAFVRNSLTAEVVVHARGFKGQQVPVTLKREGAPLATKTAAFSSDDETVKLTFSFTPDQTGRFVYTVSAPNYPNEAVTANNQKAFTLKVIRDRVRVLLVAGRPSWDERFLRGLLRQDANVELISFYILRSNTDDTKADQSEMSLIQFPREQIFHEKIDTFDLIVLVNFGHGGQGVSIANYEAGFRDYVKNGGALVLVGGDMSFAESELPGSFESVLPLETQGPADVKAFRARLTNDGARHPITAVGQAGQSAETAWAALPDVPGLNMTRAKAGSTVLVDHPVTGAPVVAVWELGRGRSMAIATDGSWYWAFPSHATGAPTRLYERFWANAVRWLVRDPDLTSLTLTAEPSTVEPGQPVAAVVQARLPDYTPAGDAEVVVELLRADDGQKVAERKVQTGADGVARVEFEGLASGAYKLKATSSKDGKSLGEAFEAAAVRAVGSELADAQVRPPLLEAIAKATRGNFFDESDFNFADVPRTAPPLVEVGRSKDQPLWDRWYWLVVLVLVLGAEWAVRRRYGYV